jgi:AAA+ superfamily predicted ATPase
MEEKKIARNENVEKARQFVEKQGPGFREHSEIVEAIAMLVGVRTSLAKPEKLDDFEQVSALEQQATQLFHQRLQAAEQSLAIVQIFERHGLEPLDRELLLLLATSDLGIVQPLSDMEDLQKAMRRNVSEQLKVARALSEGGALAKAGLITVNDPEDMSGFVTVDPSIMAPFLGQNTEEFEGWNVERQEQIFDKFSQLFAKLRERSASLDSTMHFLHHRPGFHPVNRKIERLTRVLWATLERHPEWPISCLRWETSWPETQMVMVLIGKELGFCDADDDLFLGEGLARAASTDMYKVIQNLGALKRERPLQKEGFIRICGGYGDAPVFDDEATLRTCEFELTEEFRSRIGLSKNTRQHRTRFRVRTPSVKLEDLALSEEALRKIRLIVVRVKFARVMMEEWGLGKALSYGRGLTVLFAGGPGLGKTASAEALAHELGKPLLTVNYAEVQNCYVGETEKNICRIFKEAAEADAVLFWDEADAMLYRRDLSNRSWENREVNVLLQELERFEGVCIMASNRKMAFDEALERRIMVKVEFERPSAELRRQIWRKRLPSRMLLSPDVNIDQLAEADLTGGEIKNAAINGALFALARNPLGPVTMTDFEQAIDMELRGRWKSAGSRPIGFRCGPAGNAGMGGADTPVREAARNGARRTKAKL